MGDSAEKGSGQGWGRGKCREGGVFIASVIQSRLDIRIFWDEIVGEEEGVSVALIYLLTMQTTPVLPLNYSYSRERYLSRNYNSRADSWLST